MVATATLKRLAELEREMNQSGRSAEEKALREARRALGRGAGDFFTAGAAAKQLGVPIPMLKSWIERGVLAGGPVGGRWLVTAKSVERLVGLQKALADLDKEGNPTAEEIQEIERRPRPHQQRQVVSTSRP